MRDAPHPGRPRYSRAADAARAVLLALAAAGVWAAPSAAQTDRVALVHATVSEPGEAARALEPLSFGVPLPRGRVREPDELRCWDEDGAALPAQARALSRWPDGSLRWALIDTALPLGLRARRTLVVGLSAELPADAPAFRLSRSDQPRPDDPPLPAGTDWALAADDGTTRWPLLARGARGDTFAGLSARLDDTLGNGYVGVLRPQSIEILESGSRRLALQVRGALMPTTGGALPAPFFTFTARVHLLADLGRAQVEFVLENTPLHDPPGPLAFRSCELRLDGPAGARQLVLPSSLEQRDVPFSLSQAGANAASHLHVVDGAGRRPSRSEDLWAGVLGADGKGDFALLVDSAPNHPAALRYEPGGPLRVQLLAPAADPAAAPHWLDDATRKTFRLVLLRGAGPEGRGAMLAVQRPAHVALDPADVAASGAWGDTGRLFVPAAAELAGRVEIVPRDPPTGWAHWGEWHTRNTRVAGSPRVRLSVFLEAVQSGSPALFELALARARHAMDLRPYHLEGFSAERFPKANLHEGTPHANEAPELRLGRSGMAGRFPEHKRGIPAKGHGYNGFDPEHMTLDDVYECWLLTGDWGALGALRSAGEAMLTWRYVMPGGNLLSARVLGWTLRALVQVHRATGDPRYLAAAADMVARADAQRGRGAIRYLIPVKPDRRHLEHEPSESPWMLAVALHGLCAYHAESGDARVPPMLADLSGFVMSAFRGNGFLSDLPVDRPASAFGPELVKSALGTSQWIPGALANAAFVTGDFSAVDRLEPFYLAMRARSDSPVRFGAEAWHWWNDFLLARERPGGAGARR